MLRIELGDPGGGGSPPIVDNRRTGIHLPFVGIRPAIATAASRCGVHTVTERGFDEPVMALLRAEGWSRVRLTHGLAEFGKDVIARRDGGGIERSLPLRGLQKQRAWLPRGQ